jgi:NAD(P)-dependent dehydrogenase (short-subunit alcohol dehydrogenase family)
VNAVYPGIIETPIYDALEGLPKQGPDGKKLMARDPKALGAALAPLGRAGSPEDVAGSILYLASDEARYMTGSGIVIDGGLIG